MRRASRDRTGPRLAACLAALALSPDAAAADWEAIPTATLNRKHDDNFRLSATDPRDVRQDRLEVGAHIGAADEAFEFQLNPRLVALAYDDEREQDRDDSYLDMRLAAWNEVHQWTINAGYSDEGTLTSEFQDTGFTRDDIDRIGTRLSTAWTATPDSRSQYRLALALDGVNYGLTMPSQLVDYRNANLSLGYSRALSPRSGLDLSGFDSRLAPDGPRRDTTTWGLSAAWSFQLASSLELRLGLGWYRTHDENEAEPSDREPSPEISVSKAWSAWSLRARYNVETEPSSYGVVYRHENFDVSCGARLSPSLTLSLNFRLADLEALRRVPGVDDRRYAQGGIVVDWRFRERLRLSFGLDSRSQEYESSPRARSSAISMGFAYSGRVRRS